MEILEKR